jgi:ATP-dependent RNA helicase DDX10/DBP4
VSYMRSVYLHKDKSIFKIDDLPVERFAESLGLPGAPKIKFLSNEAVKRRKNASRTIEAAEAEVTEEQEGLKSKKRLTAGSEENNDDNDDDESAESGSEGDISSAEEDDKENDKEDPPVISEKSKKVRCKPFELATPPPTHLYLIIAWNRSNKIRPHVRAQEPKYPLWPLFQTRFARIGFR